jgi:hypothetical protein
LWAKLGVDFVQEQNAVLLLNLFNLAICVEPPLKLIVGDLCHDEVSFIDFVKRLDFFTQRANIVRRSQFDFSTPVAVARLDVVGDVEELQFLLCEWDWQEHGHHGIEGYRDALALLADQSALKLTME